MLFRTTRGAFLDMTFAEAVFRGSGFGRQRAGGCEEGKRGLLVGRQEVNARKVLAAEASLAQLRV